MTTLAGTFNFRDIGGMPLTAGGVTRPGVLFRSDALATLTPEGLEQLAATDIGVIADFRTRVEQQMAPDRLPASRSFAVVELPLLEGAMTGLAQQAMQAGVQGGDPDAAAAAVAEALDTLPTLGELYVGMLEHGGGAFAHLARLVAAASGERKSAVLVHCTAGKDRTGVAVALLLDAVGTERAAILADYTESESHLAGPWAEDMYAMIARMGVPLTPGIRALVTGSPAEALESVFAWVDARGGSEAYLRSGGLTESETTALRSALTA